MATYDYIISLGGNCAPAMAIRNYFNLEQAFPFDWWICDIRPLCFLIQQRFDRMFEKEDLIIVPTEGTTVVSKRYWVKYHHDFDRNSEGIVKTPIDGQIPQVREKYRFLTDRMQRLVLNSRVLFIRDGLTQYETDGSNEAAVNADLLITSLRQVLSESDITVLCLVNEELLSRLKQTHVDNIPGVIWDTLGPPTGEMWRTHQFRDLFERQNLVLAQKS